MAPAEYTSRRGALAAIVRVSVWCAAAASGVLAGCAAALGRRGGVHRTAVATLGALPPGAGMRASLGGDASAVVVNVDGRIRAFRAVCTHEGCPLGWNAQQHLIRCPCHGGAYDTSGHVVSGPPPAPLTELRTAVEHGSIYVLDVPK
jgi:Rieske Fe-S protein